jgi:squalene-hopene/tetraprenyl-beta-curcumene cyclase
VIASETESLRARVSAALDSLTRELLDRRNELGHWRGKLSSSALSTAVATIALGEMDHQRGTNEHPAIIGGGLRWLAENVNADGGWGDTIRSKSNISTTALCWAAFGAARADEQYSDVIRNAERWLLAAAGSMENLPNAIASRYGKDRTFSVPILMTCALAGRIGPAGWRKVPPLPFELAVFPRSWFGALKLPVVSYALPALIAIGQVIHHHAPSRNPFARVMRNAARARTLDLLTALQPTNGGFLEATPLTAFVTMSLASAGQAEHSVAQQGAAFLRTSVRDDGSWPIDTDLATWVTTLSIKALASHLTFSMEQRAQLRSWLIAQQYKTVHSYTGAAPGGWAWTDLPGGVPDADDTAGALLALFHLGHHSVETISAVEQGVTWLLGLQNSDGGFPTFCRGWGTLPFDRSAPDLTAHGLRAFQTWHSSVNVRLRARISRAAVRAVKFIGKSQRQNGSFVPLWFGNENGRDDENPVYGTAQVLIALNEIRGSTLVSISETVLERAARFLVDAQHPSGGWGGDRELPESLEETALAVEALLGCEKHRNAAERGVARLLEMVGERRHEEASPIGFYFARLWYYERLYPLIFSVSALSAATRKLKNG